MESTVYGHAGQPKSGPEKMLPVANVKSANLGLENQDLSAKAVVESNSAAGGTEHPPRGAGKRWHTERDNCA